MIIVEGMDNTGKTTLAKTLARDLQLPYVHLDKPTDKQVVFQDIIECLNYSKPLEIRDRFTPISEMIYGPICRGESLLEGDHWRWINMLGRSQSLLIHCRPPDEKVFHWNDRDQMDGVIDNSQTLLEAYDSVFSCLKVSYPQILIEYDYTNHERDYEKVLRAAILMKEAQETLVKSLNGLEEIFKNQFV